jgi:hypothetical protein
VEAYFKEGTVDFDFKVRNTSLAPLYFQHPGHSMTIVGFEKKKDGSKNLIVFDPMFHDAANIMRLVDAPPFTQKSPADMLKAYRRGTNYLKRHNEFEVLKYVVLPGVPCYLFIFSTFFVSGFCTIATLQKSSYRHRTSLS